MAACALAMSRFRVTLELAASRGPSARAAKTVVASRHLDGREMQVLRFSVMLCQESLPCMDRTGLAGLKLPATLA
jgi:hypothetical protein